MPCRRAAADAGRPAAAHANLATPSLMTVAPSRRTSKAPSAQWAIRRRSPGTTDLGRHWWITETCIKAYPSCRYLSGPVDRFAEVVAERALTPADIERVVVRLTPTAAALPMIAAADAAPAADDPDTPLALVFNAPYQIALVAHGVDAGPGWYDPAHLENPSVLDFMRRVEVVVDPDGARRLREGVLAERHHRISPGAATGVELVVGSETIVRDCEYLRGDPWSEATRASDAGVAAKFRAYADGVLPPDRIERTVALVLGLERLGATSELTATLVAD